uniref:RAI1-like domain-containing protein n=1 Tax=Tetranychus urticae TaxID=32264 RepID=T1KE43_TETUR
MGRIRKDALDLEFLPVTRKVKFKGPKRIGCFSNCYGEENQLVYRTDNSSQRYLVSTELNEPLYCLEEFNPDTDRFQMRKSFIAQIGQIKIIDRFHLFNADHLMFVTDEDPSKKRKQQSDNNTRQNKLAYSRFKVIKKITKQVVERESDSNTELDVLSTVSISKIGQHHVLHLGNSEFVLSKDDVEKPIAQASFAALKLGPNLYKKYTKDFNIDHNRLMYWWASALLCGVKTLICGDLNEDFTLFKLDELPASLLNKKAEYERKKFLHALDKILHFIKSEVKEINKFYDIRLDVKTKEVTAPLSVSLFEDSVSPNIPVSLSMLKNLKFEALKNTSGINA